MSKAFTRESDDSDSEELPIRHQLPPGTRNYITRAGADRLQHRLAALLAKKQSTPESDPNRRKLDAAIRQLQQLVNSLVIPEIPADHAKIAFGATIVTRNADGGEEKCRIVGVDEADPANDAISWLSPLARALLTHRAGERIKFHAPAGEQELTIVSVDY